MKRTTGWAMLSVAASFVAMPSTAWADEPPPEPPAPPILTLHVENDRDIEVVDGPIHSSRVIFYFHGVCGDPLAFRSWSAAVARYGTLVSLRGDQPCADAPGRSRWGYDHGLADRRVTHAIATVNALRVARHEALLDGTEVTALGYSQGARRVEWLAAHFPKRYRRVAMIAGSFKPEPGPLSRKARFLVMAGAWDRRTHLREAADDLHRAGLTVTYLELPKAKHGEYGPSALQTMDAGLDWLFKDLP